MDIPRLALLALGIVLVCAGAAAAQEDKSNKPLDFKTLVPPVVPLPPNSQLAPGAVGGNQTPYTTAPLQNPGMSQTQSAPGIRFSIPAR